MNLITVNKKIGTTTVSFNPSFYRLAIDNYKKGCMREIIALMEAAEIDSHVAGCLMGRRAGFKREWRVTELSEAAGDVAAKEFVEQVFLSLNMRELFEDISDARMKRFSVLALDWEVKSGKQVITKAKKIEQKYFRYDPKDEILKLDFGRELREIPPDSALICETNRTPILIPVLRDFILKEFGLESWASFIETFGEAFIIGRYPAGSDTKIKDELEAGIKALAMSSRGIMPDGSSIDLIEAKRSTGDHNLFVDRADKSISIVILGHANAVDRSQSMQIGENVEAFKVKRDIALDDIYFIEEQIRRGLVKLLVDRNFGSARYPIFTIDKSEPIDIRERLAVLEFAWETGFKIHPDELGRLGLYKFEDQEPLQKQLAGLNLLD